MSVCLRSYEWRLCFCRPALFVAGSLCLAGALCAAPPATESKGEEVASDAEARKKQLEETRKEMRERARATKVQLAGAGEDDFATLNETPFLYFTNEPHRIIGGSLWGWAVDGRPVAICKVEKYDRGRDDQTWLYCLASLSEEKIDVAWRDGQTWSAKAPGIVRRDLPDAPVPEVDARLRLRQMKDLSRRFSATDSEPNGPGRTELRLLSQPLWRYSDTDSGLVDGALFATEGSAALFLIEVHQSEKSKPAWRYAAAGMSAWALSLKLDGQEVWQKPFTAGPAPYDNWIFRWEVPPGGEK
jgi:hypothetical protein